MDVTALGKAFRDYMKKSPGGQDLTMYLMTSNQYLILGTCFRSSQFGAKVILAWDGPYFVQPGITPQEYRILPESAVERLFDGWHKCPFTVDSFLQWLYMQPNGKHSERYIRSFENSG